MKRRNIDMVYCRPCTATVKHEVLDREYVKCSRCGCVKKRNRVIPPTNVKNS